MRKRRSSKTAELAAMIRTLATHSRYASQVMNDPYAKYFLGPSILLPYLFNRLFMLINPCFWNKGMNAVGFLLALCRHRFMSDQVLENMDENIGQIIMIGGGYDTNFLRIPKQPDGAGLFELDHPNTQFRKKRIIEKCSLGANLNISFIGTDLEQDDIPVLLYKNGLNRGEAVLVIAEGVLPYLSNHSLDRLLHSIANLSGKVRFVGDYRIPEMKERNVSFSIKRWRMEFKILNEQYISFFSEKDMERKLIEHGFKVMMHQNMAQLWKEYTGDEAPRHLQAVGRFFVAES